MYNNIKEVITHEFDNIIIDKEFCKKVNTFLNYWWYKKIDDTDHSEFLGSAMIGSNRIIFSAQDSLKFFKEVLDKDEFYLGDIYRKLPDINPKFKTHSNPFYLTVVILMHMTYETTKLKKEEKIDLLKDLYLIFSFKVMSSILNHNFKYKPNPAVVKMVFEKMSNKYLIKRLGSWAKVLEYKTEEIIPPRGIHANKLARFKTDDATYVVQQIVGGYKSMIKNIFALLVEINNSNLGIANSSTLTVDEDGTEKTVEMVFNHGGYVNYCKSIINSFSDFYNEDYINLIARINPKMDVIKFQSIMSKLTEEPYPKEREHDYIEKIMISSFNYLSTKGINSNYQNTSVLFNSLNYLKGYWSSGKMKEPMARDAKDFVFKIVNILLGGGNKNTIPPLVMGFCLYIYLRSIMIKK